MFFLICMFFLILLSNWLKLFINLFLLGLYFIIFFFFDKSFLVVWGFLLIFLDGLLIWGNLFFSEVFNVLLFIELIDINLLLFIVLMLLVVVLVFFL